MNKILSLTAALLMSSLTVSAQELTLDECVSLALENNARIRTAEYSVKASHDTSREAFNK